MHLFKKKKKVDCQNSALRERFIFMVCHHNQMCMQSLNLPHVGCARSLPFGPSWLPMANNVPGLKHHSTRICKEYKEISTNKHSAQCCHAWHLSEDCREGNARERALTPTQARVCIETDPEVMAAGTFQGGFYNLRALRE